MPTRFNKKPRSNAGFFVCSLFVTNRERCLPHFFIRDSLLPIFMHYNIQLILSGWIVAQVL
ncbi:hypothetical protein [Zobellella aerophila]|uniref:Uncharacterized protein n=1 Tax=Zobellella aerophila TaxID=870480 RepID=A0ABP6W8N6_9GAMM